MVCGSDLTLQEPAMEASTGIAVAPPLLLSQAPVSIALDTSEGDMQMCSTPVQVAAEEGKLLAPRPPSKEKGLEDGMTDHAPPTPPGNPQPLLLQTQDFTREVFAPGTCVTIAGLIDSNELNGSNAEVDRYDP